MDQHKLDIRKEGLPVQYREFDLTRDGIDEENRTLTFSFSSEYEVERWWGIEVLGHGDGEILLDRLNNKGAYLMDHIWGDQRGVVEKAWVDNKRGMVTVRLSKKPAAEELWQDHLDGIRVHVSVGYRVHELELVSSKDGLDTYRVTKWEPLEVSSVSIPADPSVGLGRSDTDDFKPVKLREVKAMDKDDVTIEETATAAPTARSAAKTETAVSTTAKRAKNSESNERTDAQLIAQTGEQYGATELASRFISQGKSYDEFRDELLGSLHAKRNDSQTQSTALELDLPKSDLRNYSVVRGIRAAVSGNWKDAGLEREISMFLGDKMDREADGLFVPHEVLGYGMRQQSVGDAAKGGNLVATELNSEYFIEALRAETVLGSLGARVLTGLVGNVDIPKQVGSATFYWLGEDGEPTDSDLDFGLVQLRPNTIAAAVPLTRRILMQSSPNIEALVRQDMLQGLALGIDYAGMKGSGTGNEPLGIQNVSGVGAVDLSGGPDWALIVELETDVAEANALAANMAYLMRPSMRGTLKNIEKAANTGRYLYESGMVNDYRAEVTTQMDAGDIMFGDFSQLMFGMWGVIDVVPDTSTKVASGGLVMRMFQDADVAVRHATAFSYGDNGV